MHQNIGQIIVNTLCRLNIKLHIILMITGAIVILLAWLINLFVEKLVMPAIRVK